MTSGKTDDVAQLQLSRSTALKSDHGVTDHHDVSNGNIDDLNQQHDINDGGMLVECAVYTSAYNDFSPPTDLGSSYVPRVNDFFDTCIHRSSITDKSKLSRLLDLCKGKANAAIRSCALIEPTAGYAHAKLLLQNRFGDEHKISQA